MREIYTCGEATAVQVKMAMCCQGNWFHPLHPPQLPTDSKEFFFFQLQIERLLASFNHTIDYKWKRIHWPPLPSKFKCHHSSTASICTFYTFWLCHQVWRNFHMCFNQSSSIFILTPRKRYSSSYYSSSVTFVTPSWCRHYPSQKWSKVVKNCQTWFKIVNICKIFCVVHTVWAVV